MFAVLEATEGDALDAPGVLAKLAATHDIDAEEEPLAIIAARLGELAALGLVDELR